MGQLKTGNQVGGNHILEHIAGPDRRQLIRITDEQKLTGNRYRLEQGGGKGNVQHGTFVNNKKITVKGICLGDMVLYGAYIYILALLQYINLDSFMKIYP